MAFPSDLTDVVVFKIHPAIGIARLSRNDDYFVFGKDPGTYKSNGLMKRQAVQFRIFAYGDNHVGLGELTPKVMAALGISAVWSASRPCICLMRRNDCTWLSSSAGKNGRTI